MAVVKLKQPHMPLLGLKQTNKKKTYSHNITVLFTYNCFFFSKNQNSHYITSLKCQCWEDSHSVRFLTCKQQGLGLISRTYIKKLGMLVGTWDPNTEVAERDEPWASWGSRPSSVVEPRVLYLKTQGKANNLRVTPDM